MYICGRGCFAFYPSSELNLEILVIRYEKYWGKLDISRSFIRIFEVNSKIYCTRGEKYSSKLDIFRSFVRIFAINRGLKDTFTIKSRHRNHDKRI